MTRHLATGLVTALLLGLGAPALAQAPPAELPGSLEVTMERPDEARAHLSLRLERDASGVAIVGCQTARAGVGCRATRRIVLSAERLAHLERLWRAFAAGAACRIRRPRGRWTDATIAWTEGQVRTLVWARGDEGLSPRCFASERVAGFFLRVWRER